tara:strand:+ start:579 stop:2387 length:1809 start_codon:yes stop_codon:yes gene_type:complete
LLISKSIIVIIILSCSVFSQKADLVIKNGFIWTVDKNNSIHQALAISGDSIIYVGSNTETDRYIDSQTEILDLDGAMVTPGFYDNHVHFESTGRLLYGLNLLDVSTEKEFTKRIRSVNDRYAKDTWITGGDWSAYETWLEGDVSNSKRTKDKSNPYGDFFLPNKKMIDKFTRNRPVLVRRFDRKVYLANSVALKKANISKGVPDPEGIVVQRNRFGEPTGILFNPISNSVESTVLIKDSIKEYFSKIMPKISLEQKTAETIETLKKMSSVGVTSYCDVTSDISYLNIYKSLRDRGKMTARVRYRPSLDKWKSVKEIGSIVGYNDKWIRYGATKAWIDGIMGNSSARFYEPYSNDPSSKGIWRNIMFPFERSPFDAEDMQSNLERLAINADANNIQLTVHAIGDAANGYLLKMLENIINVNGIKDRRFRLVHAQVMSDNDIKRAGELKIVAEVQPFHVADDMRWMEERIGNKRSEGAYAFRRLWDAGAIISFGSDSPGTNASRYYLNPMLGIYSAVSRKTLSGAPESGWFPSERLTVEEAIRAYTFNTAYASFEDDIKGSLEVGKLADLVVLSDNLLQISPAKIKDVYVKSTIVGGKIVYQAK